MDDKNKRIHIHKTINYLDKVGLSDYAQVLRNASGTANQHLESDEVLQMVEHRLFNLDAMIVRKQKLEEKLDYWTNHGLQGSGADIADGTAGYNLELYDRFGEDREAVLFNDCEAEILGLRQVILDTNQAVNHLIGTDLFQIISMYYFQLLGDDEIANELNTTIKLIKYKRTVAIQKLATLMFGISPVYKTLNHKKVGGKRNG